MNEKVLWALLWKHGCGHPHIEPVDKMLSAYRMNYQDNRQPNGWVPLYIGSKEECEQAANSIRNTLIQREPNKLARELMALL